MDKIICLHVILYCNDYIYCWEKTRLFHSPFLISTGRFHILAEAFRNDYVAACSTALRSATEKNELGGYVTVPCSSKITQRSSTADWPNF